MFLSFLLAGFLFDKSYSAWQAAPVATSISTHPIGNLDFPSITVCPPKGSHTALNYDLMGADNKTLTHEQREGLKRLVKEVFIEQSHKGFVETILAATSSNNLINLYHGFQSFPKKYGRSNNIEVKMWNTCGSWHTPWFGETYDDGYYKEDKYHHIILELPENIRDVVGHGHFVIELEVDIREPVGWQEYVEYSEGPKRPKEYTFYTEGKSWQDAEAHCKSEGGHLASVLSKEENMELFALGAESDLWLGGHNLDNEGVWEWTDGSPWTYTTWAEDNGKIGKSKCLSSIETWWDWDCKDFYPYICQNTLQTKRGTTKLELSKDQLDFGAFNVWYSYKTAGQELLDLWENKRMTGFRLNWRIKNPPQIIESTEAGGYITTPSFRTTFNRSFYESSHSYQATLLFSEDLIQQVGNGSLVIWLEVDTREQEGWHENFTYRGSNYYLYKEPKSWAAAEAHCQGEGGHLASILTEEEELKILTLVGDENVWIGGKDRESNWVWSWTDNRTWGFTEWVDGEPDNDGNCVQILNQKWTAYSCDNLIRFVCQFTFNTVTKSTNFTFEYTKDEIGSSFTVKHEYLATSQELVDSWEDRRMTGFRLSWFLQDSNGSRLTEVKPDTRGWRPGPAVPMYKQPEMDKMVRLASKARANNMTTDHIVLEIIKEKSKLIENRNIEYVNMCSEGQIRHDKFGVVFDSISLDLSEVTTPIIDEDIKAGIMLFSVVVYCSEPVALSQFLHSLLSSESPRTIIQATVNTIESDNVKEPQNIERMKQFYLALDKIFHFQLGKILLAISSQSEIAAMTAKEWPYLTHYSQEIEQCLKEDSCQGVSDAVHTLGN